MARKKEKKKERKKERKLFGSEIILKKLFNSETTPLKYTIKLVSDGTFLGKWCRPSCPLRISSTSKATNLFGLRILQKKTAPQQEYCPLPDSVGVVKWNAVQNITRLECAILRNVKPDKVVDNKLVKSNKTFGRLHKHVLINNFR